MARRNDFAKMRREENNSTLQILKITFEEEELISRTEERNRTDMRADCEAREKRIV